MILVHFVSNWNDGILGFWKMEGCVIEKISNERKIIKRILSF
jgi:hypothetical protein